MIFDYWGPTDFKFAGLDDSINKLVLGYRDASAAGMSPHRARSPVA